MKIKPAVASHPHQFGGKKLIQLQRGGIGRFQQMEGRVLTDT